MEEAAVGFIIVEELVKDALGSRLTRVLGTSCLRCPGEIAYFEGEVLIGGVFCREAEDL